MQLHHLLLLGGSLAAAAEVHSGFCYGNRWDQNTPKNYTDFRRGFESAQSIEGAGVKFNSARLFTSVQHQTPNKPIEAFQAAIDTNTTLLLGIWIGEQGIDNELSALDQAFAQHGEQLANLIVGISVGNEDIYRGMSAGDVKSYIKQVREHFAAAPYANLMKDKPIGHVDTTPQTLYEEVDFVGSTVYPFWAKDTIDWARQSFDRSVGEIQQKAGDKPVWITETGWPAYGPNQEPAMAGLDELQKYWTEVGCSLFGKTNVWWFQLENDNDFDETNWAVLNYNRSARIDFTCPGQSDTPKEEEQQPAQTTLVTMASTPTDSPSSPDVLQ